MCPKSTIPSGVECTCLVCGATFHVKPSKVLNGRGKYCSRSCLAKSRTGERNGRWIGGPVECTCQECGKTFTKVPAAIAKGEGRYCSVACKGVAQSRLTGEKSPHWKGKPKSNVNGYIRINRADGNHIFEHRYVMEQHLGRPLRSNEHIHHRNHNKADNRIENLQIVSPSEHARMHTTGRTIGRWAKQFDACIGCGTSERRHWAQGYCYRCYIKHCRS
jgi:hypothetical protein